MFAPAHRPRLALLTAAAVLVLAMACAPVARYRVLSFFFDGVPAPPGVQPAPQTPAASERAVQVSHRIPRPTTPIATPRPIVSIHAPVREHQCRECHSTSGRLDVLSKDARLCDKCHLDQRVREGWNHGPINLGTCIPCHRPHESQYPHLLDQPVPDLCLTCHADELSSPAPYHLVSDLNDCTACHDPHRMY